MNQIRFAYLPLSFITSDEEIRRQVKNTIICRYVVDKFKNPTKLLKFLKSTRYGFTASAQDTGKNKLLRISDIKNGVVDWETVPYCDCEREEDYLLQINDILIARTGGTTGKSFIVKEIIGKPVFASYLISLRVNEKLNPDYLYLFLNSYAYWSQIVQMKKGSAQPNVNAEKLKELVIPYCDLKIQEKLVALANNSLVDDEFHSLFEVINETLEKVDLVNELKTEHEEENLLISKLRQSILQEAVQGKLVPQDPADEPATELLKRIKAEKLRLMREKKIKKEKPLPPISPDEVPYELPEGWMWVRLREIIILQSGTTVEKEEELTKGEILYIKVGDMNLESNEYEITTSTRFVNSSKQVEKYLIPENSIIFPKRGGAISTNKKRVINKRILADSNIMAMICPKTLFLKYLYYWFQTIDLWQLNSGTSVPQINNKDIEPILFPIPPFNEQKRIVAKVDKLIKLCDELEEQIRQSKEESERLMQAVLREAFKGKGVEESKEGTFSDEEKVPKEVFIE